MLDILRYKFASQIHSGRTDKRLKNSFHEYTILRVALDQDGNIISIVIARSSGNMRYDNLSYKIVQEASYPSIPKSFGLTRTYHQYGILLYDIGPGPHQNIGVSPYLEGE